MALPLFAALVAAGCSQGISDKQVTEARSAVYQGDFNQVFSAVVDEVKKDYPHLRTDPPNREIMTAWHPIPLKEHLSTHEGTVQGRDTGTARGPNGERLNQGGDSDRDFQIRREKRNEQTDRTKRFFVRFDVRLEPSKAGSAPGAGGPWKVVVTGEASEYDGTTAPMPLKGAERPYWLDTRVKKLEVAIHERLKEHQVAAAAPAGS